MLLFPLIKNPIMCYSYTWETLLNTPHVKIITIITMNDNLEDHLKMGYNTPHF